MRLLLALFAMLAGLAAPGAALHAQSSDVAAKIVGIDTSRLTISLDDGKTYQVPEEFNFEGLQAGAKVVVFYTEVKGKRIVDDLQVEGE